VPLADRQIAVLEPGGSPDWLVAGFGSVWVHRDDGNVMRIDPATQAVIAVIDADVNRAGLCQGIGTDGTSIWTCSGSDLVRVDPATNATEDVVRAGKIFGQGRLVSLAGHVWVLTGDDGERLVGVDSATLQVGEPIALDAGCRDLAVGGDAVWAACTPADLVLRIDPASGAVTDRITVKGANQLSVGADAVWVGSTDGIVRIDLASRQPRLAVKGAVPGDIGSVWASAEAVWLRLGTPFLTRIDPATSRVVERISAPEYDRGGDVIGVDGTLWATDSDNGVIVHLR